MKGSDQSARPRQGRLRKCLFAALLSAPLAVSGVASAGGLVLPGSGPVATGRAGASVASIDDPSAISINPARLAAVRGTTIHVGAALIDYRMKFQRAGAYEETSEATDPWEGQPYPLVEDASSPPIGLGPFQAVPVIAVASDLGGAVPGLTVAAGVFAPNAYPTRSYGDDYALEQPGVPPPPGRYDIVSQEAAIVLPSIAAGYQAGKLQVGGRFSFGFADIKARTFVWGLENFEEWVGKDGEFTIDVKDSFVPAFGVGAHYAITDAIEVGAAWNSAVNVDAKGTGTSRTGSGTAVGGMPVTIVPNNETPLCERGGTMDALKACLSLSLPWNANLGGRYVVRGADGRQVADVELDLVYEAWSEASDYDVIVDGVAALVVGPPPIGLNLQPSKIRHNLQDTMGVRLGGSWQKPVGPGTMILRGGLAYDTAAAKENWERIDFDGAARTTATVGASLRLAKVQIDVGGGVVVEGSRTQGVGCNPPASPPQGCTAGSQPAPLDERTGPDPIQPTTDAGGQKQSPFNEGTYDSGYTLLMLGVSTWF